MNIVILPFKNKKPILGKKVYIADGAVLIGDIEIQEGSSIWFNCVLRGDVNFVKIGKCTNIQDGSVLHVSSHGFSATGDKGSPTIIGDHVTVGHNATIHACKIDDFSLIGMGSVILDRAEIKKMALVAAGSIITPGTVVGEKELWAGNPAKFRRNISKKEEELIINTPKVYKKLSEEFLKKSF
tara:strand:+ start:302 stop:850 length:549 start_codon:yes stop_codon:yes gene_type:complete